MLGSQISRAAFPLGLALAFAACGTLPGPWLDRVDSAREGDRAFLLGRYREAEQHWQNALEAAERGGRPGEAAKLHLQLARLFEARGDYQPAELTAAGVADYAQNVHDDALQARAMSVLALVQRRQGRQAASLATAQSARGIARRAGAPAAEAESLLQIGAAYQAQGDLERAYRAYRQGVVLAEATGDRPTIAALQNDLGGLHRLRAEYRQAEEAYRTARRQREELGDVRGTGRVLGNLCNLYQNLNDLHRALDLCRESLAIAHALGDRKMEANNLNNIGGIHRTLQEYPQAADAYHRSLRLKRKLRDRAGEAGTLANLGDVHRRKGDLPSAIRYAAQSLRIAEELNDRSRQSAGHYLLGLSYLDIQRYTDACAEFAAALGLQATIGQPELLWRSFDGLGRCWKAQSNSRLAIFFGKQAVNAVQRVRANIYGMDPDLQRDFLRDKSDVYRRLADLLIDQGRLAEAQQVLAMLKEEEYFDFLRRSGENDPRGTVISSTKLEARELARYNQIARELVKIWQEFVALRDKADPSPADVARMEELEKSHLDVALQSHKAFLTELASEFQSDDRAEEFGKKDLENLEALSGDLQELDRRVLLVHYLVLKDKIRIILTFPDPSLPALHRDVALSRVELYRLIQNARAKLGDRNSDPRPELKELYKRLIAPLDPDLVGYAPEVLMLSLDQTLRYIPYAALYDGARYLVERYPVAMYNLAAKGRISKEPAPKWRAAGFGVSKAVANFSPLPSVRDELDAIVLEGGADQRGTLPGMTYVDEAFTEKQFRDVLRKGGYPLIHLASHFHFEPGGNNDQSYLLLGSGEHLTLQQVEERGYRFNGTDLMTFSACQTGLGDAGDPDAGAEVESFGSLAQKKGARAVLATLWEIADRSTANFMVHFYSRRERENETKAEALRQTQITFLRNEGAEPTASGAENRGQPLEASPEGTEANPPASGSYAHPYYWAPFVLMGNWL